MPRSTDAESPPRPPRVGIGIQPEGWSCSDLDSSACSECPCWPAVKLHGLNLEFTCEICGNYSYWVGHRRGRQEHVIGCRLTPDTRVHGGLNDVARHIIRGTRGAQGTSRILGVNVVDTSFELSLHEANEDRRTSYDVASNICQALVGGVPAPARHAVPQAPQHHGVRRGDGYGRRGGPARGGGGGGGGARGGSTPRAADEEYEDADGHGRLGGARHFILHISDPHFCVERHHVTWRAWPARPYGRECVQQEDVRGPAQAGLHLIGPGGWMQGLV